MAVLLSATQSTLLEKAARDNGFDLPPPPSAASPPGLLSPTAADGWLTFASSQAPLRLWLTARDEQLLCALSQRNVASALQAERAPGQEATPADLPSGASATRAVASFAELHLLVRRAFQLSRTLPDELYQAFIKKVGAMPRATEAERLHVQRVGQDLFRERLLHYWQGRCAITGLATRDLLLASHIKPWADCPTDEERLDVFNGLLLAAHLDRAFDQGYLTIEDNGAVRVSPRLPLADARLLGLDAPLCVGRLSDGHRAYLPWHRTHVFKLN